MEENLFIIHPSEIVRRGLAVVLQEYFSMEITQLVSVSDLEAFSGINNTLIIVMLEAGQQLPPQLDEKFRRTNQLFLVGVSHDDQPQPYEYRLNIFSSALQIQQLIQVIRKSASKQKAVLPENGDLTLREKDVIRLVALGLANKEIADRLNISIHTVISHRKNITEKLNIRSISGLTMYAIMNKLIDISDINPEELI